MNHAISSILAESSSLKATLAKDQGFLNAVGSAYQLIENTVKAGGTVFACGNGGSTCDAMHLCEELVARYKRNRPGIRAMHFMDPSMLTCWGNDVGFDDAFARCAETFCTQKDVLVAISTSGNSRNVIAAVAKAKERGAKVIGLLGKDGGKLASLCDASIIVPSQATERIQEAHITVIHIWCELLETIGIPASA
jgi:D-sedoheptulose 7-phosphate isomerase